MPGRQIFVALLVLPTVISPIVAGATWRLMFDVRFGPIGQILSFFAGDAGPHPVDGQPILVYPAIIICEVWQWTPFMFLMLLAALSNVDQSQLEAAELDGASYFRVLRAIVLPAIGPVMAIACPDPRPRPLPHLRHHLGADRGRSRLHDRDDFALHLCPGLFAVRNQLHGGDRLPRHCAVHCHHHLVLKRMELAR